MRKSHSGIRNVAALCVAATLLGACVVYPAGDPYGAYYVGGVVPVAPPPPVVEAYGAPPAPGYIWIGGYWNWVGGRHVWVGGHWVHGRPGYRWVPHHWVRARGGWRLAGGHWARRR